MVNPTPAANVAPDPSQLTALQNLGVFQGKPVEDRNRALLTAGLQMLRPSPTGNALDQFSGGVTAGLQNLDESTARRAQADQQAIANQIAQQGAEAKTTQAAAATTQAATGAAAQEETARQFDETWPARVADEMLKASQTDWNYRRYDGTPLARPSGGATATDLLKSTVEDWATALYQGDPNKYSITNPTTGQLEPNMPLLRSTAWAEMQSAGKLAENAGLGIIAGLPGEAERFKETFTTLETRPPLPKDAAGVQVADDALKTTLMTWPKATWDSIDSKGPGDPTYDKVVELIRTDPSVKAAYLAAMKGD